MLVCLKFLIKAPTWGWGFVCPSSPLSRGLVLAAPIVAHQSQACESQLPLGARDCTRRAVPTDGAACLPPALHSSPTVTSMVDTHHQNAAELGATCNHSKFLNSLIQYASSSGIVLSPFCEARTLYNVREHLDKGTPSASALYRH